MSFTQHGWNWKFKRHKSSKERHCVFYHILAECSRDRTVPSLSEVERLVDEQRVEAGRVESLLITYSIQGLTVAGK